VLMDPPSTIAHLTWSSFTGMTQEEMKGFGWFDAVHRDDIAQTAAAIAHGRATLAPLQCEFRVRHRSGTWHWMLTRGNVLRTQGKVIGWIGTCTDISKQKETEDALRQSQQMLTDALEAGEMGTWVWNMRDNTLWWDKASVLLWGREGNEETQHGMHDLLRHIHPADQSLVIRSMTEFAATGSPSSIEFRAVRPDGALQWLVSRGRLERDENGRPTRAVGTFIDITKTKVAEESLRQAQKMQALGTLAGGIAHDFNNLLLAIGGNARLAIGDVAAHHPVRSSLDEIIKASARATDLVRRILAFSARAPREADAASLNDSLQEALNLVRLSVPSNISIHTRSESPPLAVALGATELHQVIINLITNAVHAIGDQPGRIDIATSVDGAFARIVVRDTGCGMDASTRARVFDPFFTTKSAGKGTGLGLAVVHGIVQSAHGTISVDSELGVGSVFTLLLPTTSLDDIRQGDTALEDVKRGKGERILYIDDDEAIVMLTERALRSWGYRPTGFANATEAVQVFTKDPQAFDIVITDLSMPLMNGFDVVRAVQKVAKTPIVIASGYVRPQDRDQAKALGIEHVILKPNTIDELGPILAELCGKLRGS
jgi:PAS domain S-box-containing protein